MNKPLTIEDSPFRNVVRPERTHKPAHSHIEMVNNEGFVVPVVIATATRKFDQLSTNTYGPKIINERVAAGWLHTDRCPLSYRACLPNFPGEQPCADGKSCHHLPELIRQRQEKHEREERLFAENWTQEEARKQKAKDDAQVLAQAVRDTMSPGNTAAEVEALKAQVEEMKQLLAQVAGKKGK